MRDFALSYCFFESPVGNLLLAGDHEAIHYLSFPIGSKSFDPKPDWMQNDSCFAGVKEQLFQYFSGELETFDLSFKLHGTEFQKRVWTALLQIPYGETRTYGDIARELGDPKASQAVGSANGSNPIPIIIPCHRVIGANGKLTGFGGGIETKQFLLNLESPMKLLI